MGTIKDIYWFIDKSFEGEARYARPRAFMQGWGVLSGGCVNGRVLFFIFRTLWLPSPSLGVANVLQASSAWANAAFDAEKILIRELNLLQDKEAKLDQLISESRKFEQAFKAANAAKLLGGVRCFLGILGGIAFVSNIVFAFLPSQPDPQIMASLKTIQVVTNETLARVKDVQKSLAAVSRQLDGIRLEIISSKCDSATDSAMNHVDQLQGLWLEYYGDWEKSDLPSRGSLAGQMNASVANAAFPSISLDPSLVSNINDWATRVKGHALTEINAIYNSLAGSQGAGSLITGCSAKYAAAVAEAGPLPFDDRLYYMDILQLVAVSHASLFLQTGPGEKKKHVFFLFWPK
jgi:hypothetical protein